MRRRTSIVFVALLAAASAQAWMLSAADRGAPGSPQTTPYCTLSTPDSPPGLNPSPRRAVTVASEATEGASAAGAVGGNNCDTVDLSCRFRAMVVDPVGHPVVGARVVVDAPQRTWDACSADGPAELTDDAGEFWSDDVGWRSWVLVRAHGLVQRDPAGFDRTGRPVRIEMIRSTPMHVRVVSVATGTACPGAIAFVLSGDVDQGNFDSVLDLPKCDLGRTDASGRVTLESKGGQVTLVVVPVGGVPTSTRLLVPTDGAEVVVRVAPGARIEGQVFGVTGAPEGGAIVRLDVPPVYRREAVSASDGRFVFEGVPQAGADATVDLVDARIVATGGTPRRFGWAVIEQPRSAAGCRVQVRLQDVAVRGRISDSRRAGGVQAFVRATHLRPVPWGLVASIERRTEADGSFAIDGMAAGEWALEAFDADRGAAVASATIHVSATGVGDPLVLEVVGRDDRLRFRVTDAEGGGVAGALVDVFSQEGLALRTELRGLTDEVGRFSADRLPSFLTLHVRVPASSWWRISLDPSDLRSGHECTLRLAGGVCRGRATRIDGSPALAALRVAAEINGHTDAGLPVVADDRGGFRFYGIGDDAVAWLESADDAEVVLPSRTMLRAGHDDVRVWVVRRSELPSLTLRFDVVDGAGSPVPLLDGASAYVTSTAASGQPAEIVRAGGRSTSGRFEGQSPLAPGVYDVVLKVPGHGTAAIRDVRLPSPGLPPTVQLER